MGNDYLNGERKSLRLDGIYSLGKTYIQVTGPGTLAEALESFQAFKRLGTLQFIQACTKGRRVTLWDRTNGWERLKGQEGLIK
jgi:hypothetical protein